MNEKIEIGKININLLRLYQKTFAHEKQWANWTLKIKYIDNGQKPLTRNDMIRLARLHENREFCNKQLDAVDNIILKLETELGIPTT